MAARSPRRYLFYLTGGLLLLIAILALQQRSPTQSHPEKGVERNDLVRTGAADQPVREVTPDHRVARIAHKDPKGLLPLEYVETPAGRVTIQRTFSLDGNLMKEEARLDGQLVPIPGR